ncbi:MAG: hypothetical protein QOD44_2216 [Solirubrobacteraceae bacterium]|jgi:hypothetical protein|nr:hypothetical protein [Solirubrobacteraceae bacterium]MEA2318027.1 hypothetical protein [Solirubrobacteraceae bacterium]
MIHRYEGRAYVRPLEAGVVLLDTEGEPGVHRWLADLLESQGYPAYSEARLTLTVEVEPSQRTPDQIAADEAAGDRAADSPRPEN